MKQGKVEHGANGRFYSLDLLKVVAIVIIACHHQQDYGVRYAFLNFYGGRITWGYLVELFFTISGFVTVVSDKKRGDPTGVLKPFLHRFVRIWPMAALSVVVYFVIDLLHLGIAGQWYCGQPITAPSLVLSFFLVFSGWIVGVHGVNNPIWFLSVLLLCYLIFYLMRAACRRLNVPMWPLCLAVVILGTAAQESEWNLPFLMAGSSARGDVSFFIGVLLAELVPRVKRTRLVSATSLVLFVLLALRTVLVAPLRGDEWATDALLLWPLLVVFATLSRGVNEMCDNKVVSTLSGMNYEFYVWHNVILLAIATGCVALRLSLPTSRMGMLVYLAGTLVVAFAMHRFVEGRLTGFVTAKIGKLME